MIVFHLIVILLLLLLIRRTSFNSTMIETQSEMVETQAKTITQHNEAIETILDTQAVRQRDHDKLLVLLENEKPE